MAKYTDKTEEEWGVLVTYWHNEYKGELSLQEFLEMDDVEYTNFLHADENWYKKNK